MRIFVMDDNNVNRQAAAAQFKEHALTIASEYDEAEKILQNNSFDVVLIDLLIPASGRAMGGDGRKFAGEELPLGIFLALLAGKYGTPHIGVFTDSSHHDHPASACFDAFNHNGEDDPEPITVNGGIFLLINNRCWIERFFPEDLATPLSSEQLGSGRPYVRAKNWAVALACLVKFI